MEDDIFKQRRKSSIEIGKIYFWTATINKWQHPSLGSCPHETSVTIIFAYSLLLMEDDIFKQRRKSSIEIGKIYFWTATINKWHHLLQRDEYKNVVLKSLEELSARGKIDVFAFVIMPNHIHLIWRINEHNGKETAQASFLKYTAHEFKKKLKLESDGELLHYAVDAHNKAFEFWQRDSLAVNLFTQKVAYQKLNYLHYNPVQDHWKLAIDPCDYPFSTAKFYMLGVKEFNFIKDLREEF